jgi:hypothetical protein
MMMKGRLMSQKWLVLLFCWLSAPAIADAAAPKLVSKTLWIVSPDPNAAVWAHTFYTRSTGQQLMTAMSTESGSDVYTNWQRRYSEDDGKTWSAWTPDPDAVRVQTPGGVHVQNPLPGWVDPVNGRMVEIVNDGILPTGNPYEGLTRWSIRYRVSTDGGRTFSVDRLVVQKGQDPYGNAYTTTHPVDGVWIGKNCMYVPATTCVPLRTKQGHMIVPIDTTPLDSYNPAGQIWNPTGAATYTDAAVLVGTWNDNTIDWQISQRLTGDPAKSTRGMDEPTVAQMPDGRILMVARGSNDGNYSLAGYKWCSVSNDDGLHWSAPAPWKYSDGANFFSPSSCSELLTASNGKTYWIGNISPTNPSGNSPRYPLVIGQVDPVTLGLMKNTITTIDTLGPGDDTSLQLSNFYAYQDRANGQIVVDVTRYCNSNSHWIGDCYRYRLDVGAVPEPSGVSMTLTALAALAGTVWQKRTRLATSGRIAMIGGEH